MVCVVSRTGRQLQRYNKGRRQVVGCIPYRYKNFGEIEVLVISSQKNKSLMFPKGGWELDETVEQAVCRETLEEAGVVGVVECKLGQWNFRSRSNGGIYEGLMYPLHVKQQLDSWPEQSLRQRIWMTVGEAREVCAHWWMKEALDMFVKGVNCRNGVAEETQVHQQT